MMDLSDSIVASILSAILLFFADFFYQLFYPNIIARSRVRLLDKDLLFALRYILIKIKSGVPLYDAMVGIAEGDYSEVSKEFKKTVKEIATGTEDTVALENMALRNPSPFFRRTIWQITSNLRAGADITSVLESITSTITKEQKILIRRYGSELNPLILMYMMFSVIIPSLGITVVVVMSSFSGLKIPIYIFYLVPAYVFLTQIIFMRLIKAKKPMLSI
jgi:flagellar protein FlaJ